MDASRQISVVIPIYNAKEHILGCLRSLEGQTHQNMEVLLINDGSTDGTERAIKEYMAQSKLTIRYFSDSNHGQAYARNFGIRQANGEYLALAQAAGEYVGFVDSDDYLDADYLEKLYETAKKYGSDVVNSGYRVIKEDGTVLSSVDVSPFSNVSDFGRAGIFVVWSKLFRREFLLEQSIRFPEGKLYEDVPFSISAKFLGRNVKAISYIGYNYVQNPNSTMSSSAVKKSRFPFEELDAAISNALAQEGVCKEALEFEVLHFFTGFLFLYCRKAAIEDVAAFCAYAAKELSAYFPRYGKNPYVGLFRSKELPLYYRAAIWLFVKLSRVRLLKGFAYAVTRL